MRRIYLVVAVAVLVIGGASAVTAAQMGPNSATPQLACATPSASPSPMIVSGAVSPTVANGMLYTSSPGASPTSQSKLVILPSPNATANGSGNYVALVKCGTPVATAALP